MHVLAATRRTQGQWPYDISGTAEGELVRFPTRSGRCPDNCPNCGCTNAMVGIASGFVTTTFTVVDIADLDADTYAELLFAAITRDTWAEWGEPVDVPPTVPTWVQKWAGEHLAAASRYPVGAVLELRDGTIYERAVPV